MPRSGMSVNLRKYPPGRSTRRRSRARQAPRTSPGLEARGQDCCYAAAQREDRTSCRLRTSTPRLPWLCRGRRRTADPVRSRRRPVSPAPTHRRPGDGARTRRGAVRAGVQANHPRAAGDGRRARLRGMADWAVVNRAIAVPRWAGWCLREF